MGENRGEKEALELWNYQSSTTDTSCKCLLAQFPCNDSAILDESSGYYYYTLTFFVLKGIEWEDKLADPESDNAKTLSEDFVSKFVLA